MLHGNRTRLVLLAAVLLTGSGTEAANDPTPTATQRATHTIVDRQGHTVLAASGLRSNYRSTPLVTTPRALGSARTAASGTAAAPVTAAHRPFSTFTPLGGCLGCTGLEVYDNNGTTEILGSVTTVIAPSTNDSTVPDDFWYALTFDAQTHEFNEVSVSERQTGGVAQLLLLRGAAPSADQVAICGFDGSIHFYSAATKKLLPTKTKQFPITDVFRCAIGDFNGRGGTQYFLASQYQAALYRADGTLIWSVPAPQQSYTDIVVGQMDSDPALEIAVAQYLYTPGDSVTIYDGGSHKAQLHISQTALPSVSHLALASAGAPASRTLVAAESWYVVHAFDTVSGSQRWQAQTPLNIESLKVSQVLGGAAEQVMVGDAQWGSVHVLDAATGTADFAIANPEWGVTKIAVGDIDRNGSLNLLWGGDTGSSGPQRFSVADIATQKVTATSRDLDAVFTAPAVGKLLSGNTHQVVFASATTDNAYDPGSIVVMDATSGKRIAVQDVPLFQGWGIDTATRVADVDGDGLDDIVVAATHDYDGAVDVYGLTAARKIVQKSTTRPIGSASKAYPQFTALAIADADRKGKAYAAVGYYETDSTRGAVGSTVIGLDLKSGAEKWRVALPPPPLTVFGTFPASDLLVLGRDATGAELILARSSATDPSSSGSGVGTADVIRIAGSTATVVASYQGLVSSAAVAPTSAGLHEVIIGTFDGTIKTLSFSGSSLNVVADRSVSANTVNAVYASGTGSTWIVSGFRLMRVLANGSVDWQSVDNGYQGAVGIAANPTSGTQSKLWVSSMWRVDGFNVPTTP